MRSAFLFAFALLISLSGCVAERQNGPSVSKPGTPDQWDAVAKKGELTFGVGSNLPPFSFHEGDGKYWGFDIELAKAVAAKLGLKACFVPVEPCDIEPYLLMGKVDAVIAAVGVSRERERSLDFSIPYFKDGLGLLTLAGSPIQDYRNLAGRKVGVLTGSDDAREMVSFQPECEIAPFSTYNWALQVLKAGDIDALAGDYLVLQGLVEKDDSLVLRGGRFTGKAYAIALSQNQSRLRDRVNNAIMSLWESGDWQDIYETCFGEGTLYQADTKFHVEIIPR